MSSHLLFRLAFAECTIMFAYFLFAAIGGWAAGSAPTSVVLAPGNTTRQLIMVADGIGFSGSSWMRAHQVVAHLPQDRLSGSIHTWRSFMNSYCSDYGPQFLNENDVVIFVKLHLHAQFASMVDCVQERKALAVADVIDLWRAPIDPRVELDLILFSNNAHRALSGYAQSARHSCVLPHHHSNFEQLHIHLDEPIKTVGTSSGITQLITDDFRVPIKEWCRSRGVRFVEHLFREQILASDGTSFNRVLAFLIRMFYLVVGQAMPGARAMVMKQNAQTHRKINAFDVAIICPSKDAVTGSVELNEKFRPNTRLAMFGSHGIPTIAYPYVSYVEMMGGNYSLFARTPLEFVAKLDRLYEDYEFRRQQSREALLRSQAYDVKNIIEQYERCFALAHRK